MKRLLTLLICISLSLVFLSSSLNVYAANKSGWFYNSIDNSWCYYQNNILKTGWLYKSSKWYFFDTSGKMTVGWKYINNKWYYFNKSGSMRTGWLLINDKWFFLNSSGSMRTGWMLYDDNWYYFNNSGSMRTGWFIYKDEWYYFDNTGEMHTSWLDYKSNQYFFDDNGVMHQGRLKDGDIIYYFNSSGEFLVSYEFTQLKTGNIIYVSTNGSDVTGDGSKENPYATIWYANSTIKDNSAENPYTIKVEDGVYTDLEERYSTVTSDSYAGINCKNYVTYEGNTEHPENVVLKWNGLKTEEQKQAGYFNGKTIFHIFNGVKTTIKGFTLDAVNTRYCLHAETGGLLNQETEWCVENCNLVWYGTPDAKTIVDRAVFGTGCVAGEKSLIRDCNFYNYAPKLSISMFGSHDNTVHQKDVTLGSTIIFDSCYFYGENTIVGNMDIVRLTFDSKSRNDYSENSKTYIINCDSSSPIYISRNDNNFDKWGNHWDVFTYDSNMYDNYSY